MLAALAAAAVYTVRQPGRPTPIFSEATTWRGLVGAAHPRVDLGDRQIVVLRTPSLAQHLAAAGVATEGQERQWTAAAYAAQQQVLVNLSAHGVGVRPDYSFARVIDGFAARIGPRAEALLEQDPEVAGIYPVRAAFPAAFSTGKLLTGVEAEPLTLPGYDGVGVQIALLDTGVDRSQPYFHGRVGSGVDVVGAAPTAAAQADPDQPTRLERHGTELAGLLVGSGGPRGVHGAAPGATVYPIRVAGWQPAGPGGDVVYARTDQLIAGLERAVDPNGDGDAHDAARVALVGVSEPYAAFSDSPEAQAVAGAVALDTLVVAPAGNEGDAGPAFGSLDGPGGAAAALTVAATDPRASVATVHVSVFRGADVVFDARLPLLGAVAPSRPVDLAVGVPRGNGEQAADYFGPTGLGLVAGRAAVVQVQDDPVAAAVAAAQAGAAVVLLYGGNLPAGSLGLSSDVGVPVIALPESAARQLLAGRGRLAVAIGRARTEPNPLANRVTSFSSRGLAFSGALKPDLAAPGVGLATSDPGTAADGEPAFTTVNGTSAAAAAVAGAAAILAQVRPDLDARELGSLLVGTARPAAAAFPSGGAGTVDVGAAAVGELTASATSLSLADRRWRAVAVRNVSTRRLVVVPRADPALHVRPARLVIPSGGVRRVRVQTHAPPGSAGVLELLPTAAQALRIPWLVPPRRPRGTLLPHAALNRANVVPSDVRPAVLTVDAGRVDTSVGAQIEPVLRLDVLLYTASGAYVGVLARARDLLPGTYEFGITGRGPRGAVLPPGRYELRLVAWPTGGGATSRTTVRFAIQSG